MRNSNNFSMKDMKLYLKRGKEESLGRFHPWIFSGAVHHIEGDPEEGDLLSVYGADGGFLAKGHWQVGSIALRVLSFEDIEINAAFWRQRLAAALDVRRSIGVAREDNTIYRLVHGEGDFLPGLVIDMYGGLAVMQAHSVGMHRDRAAIAEALTEVMGEDLQAIYYKSETTLPFKADLHQENGFLYERKGAPAIDKKGYAAVENGLKFNIDWYHGQKTGFFVDQRDNRSLVEHYARGRKVLNMFCYTGGFSVYAMRGGAELVHSVDSSAKAIELAAANVEMNFPSDARHEAHVSDAFEYLDKTDGKYDLVILDPPAFAKHKDALVRALKGYTKLNARAMTKMPKGSVLFTFSCSQAVSKEHFRTAVFTAAAIARRKVRILHQLHQPADHPINIYHPEGEYLKGLVLYVE
jgi:23S rRNA (cytosine1962-C5)-methyltransferase